MADDNDARLAGLYREGSREEPPAHLDRAILNLARRSARRRTLAPFGNHRVALGALAGICIVSVLLVVLLPEQGGVPGLPQSLQLGDTPESGVLEKRPHQEAATDEAAIGLQGAAEENDVAGEGFDFYSVMPADQQEAPAETVILRSMINPAPVPPSPPVQIAVYVLQIDGFNTLAEAEAMTDKLAFMHLDASILKGEGSLGDYRVHVGPYTNLSELERVQVQLQKRGIKSTRMPLQLPVQ